MVTKITIRGFERGEELEIERTLVDILTDNKNRTSVALEKQPGRIFGDYIAINSVSQEGPVKWGKGIFERALENPQNPGVIYFIDAGNNVVRIRKYPVNLFYDADKVSGSNRFTWHGTFEEALNEFREAGYNFLNE